MTSLMKITLKFDLSYNDPLGATGVIHRVRNLGEEIWRDLERDGVASIGGLEAVDTATDCLVVQVKHRKKFARVKAYLEQKAKEAFSKGAVTILYE